MNSIKICSVCGSRNYHTRKRCGNCGAELSGNPFGFLDSFLKNTPRTTKLLYLVLAVIIIIMASVAIWQWSPKTDTTELKVYDVFVDLKTSSGARISWTTNKASSSQIEYGMTSSYGMVSPLYPQDTDIKVKTHAVIMTGLAKNTTYHFRVKSVDEDGNISYSSQDMSFKTSDKLDFAGVE